MDRETGRGGAADGAWPLVAGGIALGLGLALAKKLMVQAPNAVHSDWVEGLAAEHAMVRRLIREMQATKPGQSKKRMLLLMQVKTALTRHAIEEENVVYPALAEAGREDAVEQLVAEHRDVKRRLYRLETMGADHPGFMPELNQLMEDLLGHMHAEEEELFPLLSDLLGEDGNARMRARVNLQGLQFA